MCKYKILSQGSQLEIKKATLKMAFVQILSNFTILE